MSLVKVHRWDELSRATGWLPLPPRRLQRVVIKPNWVRHFHEADPSDPARLRETITANELILAVAREVGSQAELLHVADAPQFDTDWEELWTRQKLGELQEQLAAVGAGETAVHDLRQIAVSTDEFNSIIGREEKNGDPCGYRVVNLGDRSAFAGWGSDPSLLRGADFDPSETIRHHSGGRHEYCISGSILEADLVIDMPKVKTHKKAGVTLCLKNLVGINGNKNYLPHHRAGAPEDGGDEFPGGGDAGLYQRVRAWGIDRARPLLQRGALLRLTRLLRAVDVRTRPKYMVRQGNWHGNDTVWRMILDLNRALLYADRHGRLQQERQRSVLHVLDGIVAGEGDGPMAPDPRPLGLAIVGTDAVACDMVACALMGFDPLRIPLMRRALEPHPLPITELGAQGQGLEIEFEGRRLTDWRDLPNHRFVPHPGWAGHIERAEP